MSFFHKCLAQMSVSKTTTLFNSKFPSNDVKLNLNFFPSQIISLWMKNVGNSKSLYLKWRWSFSLELFEKVLLGLASLYHIQMKYPKTVYLTEQCQLLSHRNSVHSIRRGTKMSKTPGPWYINLTVYSVMHWSWNMLFDRISWKLLQIMLKKLYINN